MSLLCHCSYKSSLLLYDQGEKRESDPAAEEVVGKEMVVVVGGEVGRAACHLLSPC